LPAWLRSRPSESDSPFVHAAAAESQPHLRSPSGFSTGFWANAELHLQVRACGKSVNKTREGETVSPVGQALSPATGVSTFSTWFV
jgi:hypothetical protein